MSTNSFTHPVQVDWDDGCLLFTATIVHTTEVVFFTNRIFAEGVAHLQSAAKLAFLRTPNYDFSV